MNFSHSGRLSFREPILMMPFAQSFCACSTCSLVVMFFRFGWIIFLVTACFEELLLSPSV